MPDYICPNAEVCTQTKIYTHCKPHEREERLCNPEHDHCWGKCIPHREENKMVYELLKPISIADVIKANGGDLECQKLQDVVILVSNHYLRSYGSYLSSTAYISWDFLKPLLDSSDIEWLIEKGFLKKKEPEVFYRVGDRFKFDNFEYILTIAFTRDYENKVQLTNLSTGHVSRLAVKVENITNITQAEFNEISGGLGFKRIEKGEEPLPF